MLPGQPKPRGITDDIRRKRAKGLFDEDLKAANRLSHHNQSIKTLYEEYIGAPNGEKAHQLLHTHYRPRAAYKREKENPEQLLNFRKTKKPPDQIRRFLYSYKIFTTKTKINYPPVNWGIAVRLQNN